MTSNPILSLRGDSAFCAEIQRGHFNNSLGRGDRVHNNDMLDLEPGGWKPGEWRTFPSRERIHIRWGKENHLQKYRLGGDIVSSQEGIYIYIHITCGHPWYTVV